MNELKNIVNVSKIFKKIICTLLGYLASCIFNGSNNCNIETF
jgi:hypothetical protein